MGIYPTVVQQYRRDLSSWGNCGAEIGHWSLVIRELGIGDWGIRGLVESGNGRLGSSGLVDWWVGHWSLVIRESGIGGIGELWESWNWGIVEWWTWK